VFPFFPPLTWTFQISKLSLQEYEKYDFCLAPLLKELNLDTSAQFAREQRWWSPPAVEKAKNSAIRPPGRPPSDHSCAKTILRKNKSHIGFGLGLMVFI